LCNVRTRDRLANLYFVYRSINMCILTALCVQCKGMSRRIRDERSGP